MILLRGRIGIAVWRFDRIDKAVRRFNAVGADAVLQRAGIARSPASMMSEPYNPFTSVAGRRNRHAIYFSEEWASGRHHWTYVAGGVGGDTVNGIGVVLRNRQPVRTLMPLAVFSTNRYFSSAAVQRQGQVVGTVRLTAGANPAPLHPELLIAEWHR